VSRTLTEEVVYKLLSRQPLTGNYMPKMKRIRLSAVTFDGLKRHLLKKGYRMNPLLQGPKVGAVLTFDKPLPQGRLHGHVRETRNSFVIRQHIDRSDPYRNPYEHVRNDIMSTRRDYIIGKPKKRSRPWQ
jgi:hypothetical protein